MLVSIFGCKLSNPSTLALAYLCDVQSSNDKIRDFMNMLSFKVTFDVVTYVNLLRGWRTFHETDIFQYDNEMSMFY